MDDAGEDASAGRRLRGRGRAGSPRGSAPPGVETRAAEDLVEHVVVHPDGLLGPGERARGDVRRVGRAPPRGSSRAGPRTASRASDARRPSPRRSVITWTWPLQPGPAPIPIVGIRRRSVIAVASCSGTSSRTIEKAPASWTASASWRSARACSRLLPRTRTLPAAFAACGVQPMWPIVGMPALTSASIVRAERTPPSTLTAWAPASAGSGRRWRRPARAWRRSGTACRRSRGRASRRG